MATLHEVTVDREDLHFVDTHVASITGASLTPRPPVGLPTVEITTTVEVRPVLRHKLDAIAAHRARRARPAPRVPCPPPHADGRKAQAASR